MATLGSNTLANLTTWDDVAGRTWTSHGAGVDVVDRYAWKVERYDDVDADAWVDHSDLLQAASFNYGVAGWWQGPFGGTCTLTLEDTDLRDVGSASGDAFLTRQYWRLSVRIASGWHQQFYGRCTDVDRIHAPNRPPRHIVSIGDFVSLDAQDADSFSAASDQTSAWWVESILSSFANSQIDSPLSDHLDDLPAVTAGLLCEGSTAWGGNLVSMLAQLAMAELGLIFVDHHTARWQFYLLNWWDSPGDHYAAFIGGDDSADSADTSGSKTWDLQVRPSSVRERIKGRDQIIRWEWSLAGAGGPVVATAGGLQPPPSGQATSRNEDSDDVNFLVNALAETTAGTHMSTRQPAAVRAAFSAVSGIEAIEYAARASVGDFIGVGRDPVVSIDPNAHSTDWPHYYSKFVFRLAHRWSARGDWTCTIDTDANDLAFADEVVIT